MDARTLTIILLKVVGLITFSYAVFDVPSYFLGPYDGSIALPFTHRLAHAVAALLLPIVFGLLLWFFPGTVTNRIVAGTDLPNGFSAREFERVALTVLGAWLVAYGAVETMSSLLTIFFASRDRPELPIPPSAFVGPLAASLKVAVGLFLVFGTPRLQRVLERIRGQP